MARSVSCMAAADVGRLPAGSRRPVGPRTPSPACGPPRRPPRGRAQRQPSAAAAPRSRRRPSRDLRQRPAPAHPRPRSDARRAPGPPDTAAPAGGLVRRGPGRSPAPSPSWPGVPVGYPSRTTVHGSPSRSASPSSTSALTRSEAKAGLTGTGGRRGARPRAGRDAGAARPGPALHHHARGSARPPGRRGRTSGPRRDTLGLPGPGRSRDDGEQPSRPEVEEAVQAGPRQRPRWSDRDAGA